MPLSEEKSALFSSVTSRRYMLYAFTFAMS